MVSSMSSLKKFLGGVVSVEESLTVVPCPLFCFVSRLILKLYLDEIQGPRLCIRFGCAGEAPFFFGSSMPTYHRCRVITYLISHRSHFGSRYNIDLHHCDPSFSVLVDGVMVCPLATFMTGLRQVFLRWSVRSL